MNTPLPASCSSACPTSGAGDSGGASGTAGAGGTGGRGGASGAGGTGGAGGAGGATLGPNLVSNGDFSSAEINWSVTVQSGAQPNHDASSGQLCLVVLDVSQTVTIRWPTTISAAFAIRNGVRYQFSFSAQGLGNVASFEAKVGQAAAPYTATDFRTNETLGQTLQPYTHTFTAGADDLQAGVTFTVVSTSSSTSAVVCLDDVAVRAFQ
jgi:hypothetical protein